MTQTKAAVLRSGLAAGKLLAGVGARDAMEARLIEKAGFDFVWASSFCISGAHCVADASILSMTQFLETARSMYEAIQVPIVFDADTGYGSERNVAYATKRIEEAGMAALCIEDKAFPKQTSLLPGAHHDLLTVEAFSAKISAAAAARRSKDFVVIARTEALIAGLGQEEALRRAHAYAAAGADCILLHSKSKSRGEIEQCVRAWTGKAPLVLVPTNYPDMTEPLIEELGKVGMVIYGNHPLRAAVKAVYQVLLEMRAARGAHTVGDKLAPLAEIFALQSDIGG